MGTSSSKLEEEHVEALSRLLGVKDGSQLRGLHSALSLCQALQDIYAKPATATAASTAPNTNNGSNNKTKSAASSWMERMDLPLWTLDEEDLLLSLSAYQICGQHPSRKYIIAEDIDTLYVVFSPSSQGAADPASISLYPAQGTVSLPWHEGVPHESLERSSGIPALLFLSLCRERNKKNLVLSGCREGGVLASLVMLQILSSLSKQGKLVLSPSASSPSVSDSSSRHQRNPASSSAPSSLPQPNNKRGPNVTEKRIGGMPSASASSCFLDVNLRCVTFGPTFVADQKLQQNIRRMRWNEYFSSYILASEMKSFLGTTYRPAGEVFLIMDSKNEVSLHRIPSMLKFDVNAFLRKSSSFPSMMKQQHEAHIMQQPEEGQEEKYESQKENEERTVMELEQVEKNKDEKLKKEEAKVKKPIFSFNEDDDENEEDEEHGQELQRPEESDENYPPQVRCLLDIYSRCINTLRMKLMLRFPELKNIVYDPSSSTSTYSSSSPSSSSSAVSSLLTSVLWKEKREQQQQKDKKEQQLRKSARAVPFLRMPHIQRITAHPRPGRKLKVQLRGSGFDVCTAACLQFEGAQTVATRIKRADHGRRLEVIFPLPLDSNNDEKGKHHSLSSAAFELGRHSSRSATVAIFSDFGCEARHVRISPFNILLFGASGAGKTSLCNFICQQMVKENPFLPSHVLPSRCPSNDKLLRLEFGMFSFREFGIHIFSDEEFQRFSELLLPTSCSSSSSSSPANNKTRGEQADDGDDDEKERRRKQDEDEEDEEERGVDLLVFVHNASSRVLVDEEEHPRMLRYLKFVEERARVPILHVLTNPFSVPRQSFAIIKNGVRDVLQVPNELLVINSQPFDEHQVEGVEELLEWIVETVGWRSFHHHDGVEEEVEEEEEEEKAKGRYTGAKMKTNDFGPTQKKRKKTDEILSGRMEDRSRREAYDTQHSEDARFPRKERRVGEGNRIIGTTSATPLPSFSSREAPRDFSVDK